MRGGAIYLLFPLSNLPVLAMITHNDIKLNQITRTKNMTDMTYVYRAFKDTTDI